MVSPHMISELTNTPKDLSLHTLFHDTAKVTQTVIGSLTLEYIDPRFYADILKAFRATAVNGELEPQWSLIAIQEMLHPTDIISRRGSISQIYRPNSSDGAAPSTPELRKMKSIRIMTDEDGTTSVASAAAAVAAVFTEEHSYLLKILTMRKKQGGRYKAKLHLRILS